MWLERSEKGQKLCHFALRNRTLKAPSSRHDRSLSPPTFDPPANQHVPCVPKGCCFVRSSDWRFTLVEVFIKMKIRICLLFWSFLYHFMTRPTLWTWCKVQEWMRQSWRSWLLMYTHLLHHYSSPCIANLDTATEQKLKYDLHLSPLLSLSLSLCVCVCVCVCVCTHVCVCF